VLRLDRRIACGVVPLLFVLGACTQQAASSSRPSTSPTPEPTPAGSIPAPLPTPTDYRSICQLEGSVCSHGDDAAADSGENLPAALMRPLHLPKIEPGARCPTTPGHEVRTAGFGVFALGNGPVEAGIAGGQLDPWSMAGSGLEVFASSCPAIRGRR
jgi:hypothetical protein